MSDGRVHWADILIRGRSIVDDSSVTMTLRQLFYLLVSEGVIPNTLGAYKTLSSRTAEARRRDLFPALVDATRMIHEPYTYDNPREALDELAEQYRIDRTRGQAWNLLLGVEKDTLVALLTDWFDELGLPILSLRGYASQTYADKVRGRVRHEERPTVLLYAGDFDPSGEDISRDFSERAGVDLVRLAVLPEHIEMYNLPALPGKATDSRAAGFVARYGDLVQVEAEALPPAILRDLFSAAIAGYWNDQAYEAARDREATDRQWLLALADDSD